MILAVFLIICRSDLNLETLLFCVVLGIKPRQRSAPVGLSLHPFKILFWDWVPWGRRAVSLLCFRHCVCALDLATWSLLYLPTPQMMSIPTGVLDEIDRLQHSPELSFLSPLSMSCSDGGLGCPSVRPSCLCVRLCGEMRGRKFRSCLHFYS